MCPFTHIIIRYRYHKQPFQHSLEKKAYPKSKCNIDNAPTQQTSKILNDMAKVDGVRAFYFSKAILEAKVVVYVFSQWLWIHLYCLRYSIGQGTKNSGPASWQPLGAALATI